MIFGTSTPTPRPVGKAGKSGSGFPWWLLAAGGAAAYGVSKRKQIAQGVSKYFGKKAQGTPGAQAAASKRGQVRAESEAVDVKVARMEAEGGQRSQHPTVQSKPAVPPSGTHNFVRKPKSSAPPANPAGASQTRPSLWNKFASGVKNLVAPLVNAVQKSAAPSAKPSLWSRFTAGVKNLAAPIVTAAKMTAANASWNTVKTKAVNGQAMREKEPENIGQYDGKGPSSPPHHYPDPETADMTEAERLALYKQSPEYLAREARYAEYYRQQAYEDYRRGERGEYVTPSQLESLDSKWSEDKRIERFTAGVDGVQGVNASVANEKVIEPELRRLQVLNSLNQADYWKRLPAGMAQDLTLIEGIGPKVQKVLQENGYKTIADLASANPAKLRELLQEQKWHFMDPTSWVHQARLVAIGDQEGLQALQHELKGGRGLLPQGTEENLLQRLMDLEKIAESRRLSTKILGGVDSVSNVLSIGGNLVYAATGWEAAKKAGEAGDALGIFGGIAQIVKCARAVGQSAPKFSKIFTGVSFLGRVTGVLSIVTGGISAVTSGIKFVNSIRDEDGWKAD
ncbi:MAG: helix-hairpin-helix domain-containing protein, partial [Anaerolineales bacterium]